MFISTGVRQKIDLDLADETLHYNLAQSVRSKVKVIQKPRVPYLVNHNSRWYSIQRRSNMKPTQVC